MTQPTAGQDWDAEGYIKNAAFVAELGEPLLQLLAPREGEHVLDIGCGDGRLTEKLVQVGAQVTGLEPDLSFVSKARARGLNVLQQDAHEPFGTSCFDAIFTNAALHWMKDPQQVFTNVYNALKPGGRFVAEQGGAGNVAAITTALANAYKALNLDFESRYPWDYPSSKLQSQRLEKAGLKVISIELFPRPTPLPTGITGWLETFAQPFFTGLSDQDVAAIIKSCEAQLKETLQNPDGSWFADYVRLRFHARKDG